MVVVKVVIVPAPTNSAATTTPSVSPSASPTATAGTASPSPLQVEVTKEPDDNWAIAGVLISAAAGLVSIFLAWRAVRIGRAAASEAVKANETASKARQAIAHERRRTFELEVLRELLASFEDAAERWSKIADAPVLIDLQFGGRLSLLPAGELPKWHEVGKLANVEEVAVAVGIEPGKALKWRSEGTKQFPAPSPDLLLALRKALYDEILAAIDRRMKARDD